MSSKGLKPYLDKTKPLVGRNMNRLFVSPRKPTNPASKNALTAMTKATIKEAHESLKPDLVPILKVKTQQIGNEKKYKFPQLTLRFPKQ